MPAAAGAAKVADVAAAPLAAGVVRLGVSTAVAALVAVAVAAARRDATYAAGLADEALPLRTNEPGGVAAEAATFVDDEGPDNGVVPGDCVTAGDGVHAAADDEVDVTESAVGWEATRKPRMS